jgi:hypothetical protein
VRKTARFRMHIVIPLAATAILVGCERTTQPAARRSPQPLAAAPAKGPASFVTVSDSNPPIGATILVVGNVVSPGGVGAFRARLSYDTAALAFVDESPVPGMIRAVNPHPGQIVIAGATATPGADPRLFTLRFRVLRGDSFAAVSLDVDELTDGAFVNRARTLTPAQRGAVRLDRTLGHPLGPTAGR